MRDKRVKMPQSRISAYDSVSDRVEKQAAQRMSESLDANYT